MSKQIRFDEVEVGKKFYDEATNETYIKTSKTTSSLYDNGELIHEHLFPDGHMVEITVEE